MRTTPFRIAVAAAILATIGCNTDEKTPDGGVLTDAGGDGGSAGYPYLDGPCDPIAPTHCGLPFPSNVYLAPDPTSSTGHRVAYPMDALPKTSGGQTTDATAFNTNDGFSVGASLLAHLPGATTTGFASPDTIAHSLDADSPTVVIEADTGALVPHFAELDESTTDDARRTLIIRPVVRLKDATRYVVAIRHVVDGSGTAIAPSDAFKALRDGTSSTEVSVGRRRELYADIFSHLASAGVAKDDLQLAWDFTTSSRDDHTKSMLSIRDQALAVVGTTGPAYVIDSMTDNPFPGAPIARKITGHMTVPLYLDQAAPGASLHVDSSGVPSQNGTADFPFEILIPNSAATGTTAALLEYGHGLFGSYTEIESDYLYTLADTYHYVIFAVDWAGMASADRDWLTGALAQGDFGVFAHVPDRLHQGIVNFLLAMRMMTGAMANDAAVKFGGVTAYDPSQRYYDGNSQGGILGTVYMAITTDVTRGVLGVPGMPFALLLNRSADFTPFFTLLNILYGDPIDLQILLGLAQQVWDRADPSGYAAYVTSDNLANTPDHDVLLHIAIGDHQVTPLGGHILARAVGAKLLSPAVRPVFGLDEMPGEFMGSGVVEFDFQQPPVPITNVPPTMGVDTHGLPRLQPAAQQQLDHFLRTGGIVNYCSGPCDPE